MKIPFLILIAAGITFLTFISDVKGHAIKKDDGGDTAEPPYKLNVAPWLKTKKQKKEEKKAEEETKSKNERPVDEESDDEGSDSDDSDGSAIQISPEQRQVVQIAKVGLSMFTKLSDVVGTAQTVKSRFDWVMGLFGLSSSSAVTKEDIKSLKTQLDRLESDMKSQFEALGAAQEFDTIMSLYNDFTNLLQKNIFLRVSKTINRETQITSEEDKEKLISRMIGPDDDETQFALMKVNEMITGKSIGRFKDLYMAITMKQATCSGCVWNFNDLPAFASDYNFLQATNYGALMSVLYAQGDNSTAISLEDKMKSRMGKQLTYLYEAQKTFLEKYGSGKSYLRLQSARGGCLAYDNDKFHLRSCDDNLVLKLQIGRSGDIKEIRVKRTNKCLGYWSGQFFANGECETNMFEIDLSRVDPRYIQIRQLRRDQCVSANVLKPHNGFKRVYFSTCVTSHGDAELTRDRDNQFWEFIPDFM